jgi:hypothetical protein
MAEHQEFEQKPKDQSRRECQQQGNEEIACKRIERDGEIGAQHVLDTVGEIDEIHHPEHERKPGRDQEEQDAELEPVQNLDDNEPRGHYISPAPFLTSSDNL